MPVGAERQHGLQIGSLATVRPAVRSLSVCARSAFLVVAEASQLRLAPKFAAQMPLPQHGEQTHLQPFRRQFLGHPGVGGRAQLWPAGVRKNSPRES